MTELQVKKYIEELKQIASNLTEENLYKSLLQITRLSYNLQLYCESKNK